MEQALLKLSEAAVARHAFPGGVVGFIRGGHTGVIPFGRQAYDKASVAVMADTAYDVASITKSVPTSSVILRLAEQGRLSLDDQAAKYLPELQNRYRNDILLRHLLTFTASFNLGRPMAEIARENPVGLISQLLHAPLSEPPGTHYRYTNAPSLLLGMIAERATGETLDNLADELIFRPLAMAHTTFAPDPANTAPSGVDWRGELRGIIHDPGAWAVREQGQFPGHAGLFSTTPDLLNFAQMLLNRGELNGARLFEAATVKAMGTSQAPELSVRAGLGWDTGRTELTGPNVSLEAIVKTGFTGAIIMADPVKQLAFVHLSNRTYPETPDWAPTKAYWREAIDIIAAG